MNEKLKEFFKDRKLTRYSMFIICTATIIYIIFFIIKNITKIVPAVGSGISWFVGLFAAFIIGLVIAYLMNPLVCFLERKTGLGEKKFGRTITVIITYVIVLAAIVAIIYGFAAMILGKVVIGSLIDNFDSIVDTFKNYADSLQNWAASLPKGAFSDGVQNVINKIIKWFTNSISGIASADTITGLIGGVINLVIGIIFSVYILLYKESLLAFWHKMVNLIFPNTAGKIDSTLSEVNDILSRFIKGIAIDAVLIAILSSVGLTLVGLKFAVFMGIFAGVCNVIPYFGPFIGMIPAFLVGLITMDLTHGLIALLILFLVQQLDANLIYPKVVGKQTGLHPLYVLLAVTVGGGVSGLLGMVLAVPVAGVLKAFFDRWVVKREDKLQI